MITGVVLGLHRGQGERTLGTLVGGKEGDELEAWEEDGRKEDGGGAGREARL